MKKAIILLGLPASGKSTFVEFAKKHYDFSVFEIGDFVREAYLKYCKEHNEKTRIIDFADYCFRKGTFTSFAEEAIKEASLCKTDILLSGAKTMAEINLIKQSFINSVTILIESDYHHREFRYYKELQDSVSYAERISIESSWGWIDNDQFSADIIIQNNSSLDDFYMEIDRILSDIFRRKSV